MRVKHTDCKNCEYYNHDYQIEYCSYTKNKKYIIKIEIIDHQKYIVECPLKRE